MSWIEMDGAQGEGGGQVLRTSLALSLVTGRPVHLTGIRAGRRKPGLRRQHVTAVRAATAVGRAEVDGAYLGSGELWFRPTEICPGQHRFSVGTAGSVTLVLQTVLPALMTAPEPSELVLEGGTHNPMAPPFDYLEACYLPLLARMGPRVAVELERPGFYPAGGGRFTARITPSEQLAPLTVLERGPVRLWARVWLSNLPGHIAEREIKVLEGRLKLARSETVPVPQPLGPGNVVQVFAQSRALTAVFTAFGEKGTRAEKVAKRLAREVQGYLGAGVPVDEHLADQLLLLLALAGKGAFRTMAPSLHTRTQIDVIRSFLEVAIALEDEGDDGWVVRVGPAALRPSD